MGGQIGQLLTMQQPIRVGIIGGGQLGKMLSQEAKRMSFRVVILDPDPNCPASALCDEQLIGEFKDYRSVERLASKSDVVTYEIELANSKALMDLRSQNFPIHPAPETLHIIQNKYRQKTFLVQNKISVPQFGIVRSQDDLRKLCKCYGLPSILKVCEDAYDGKGNFLIKSNSEINEAFAYFSPKESMLEKFVEYKQELSVIVARNVSGQVESFPVSENVHRGGVLAKTIVPARVSEVVERRVRDIAYNVIASLKGAGVFGIEMFLTSENEVLINEIAPRPHNSGHYTIEACSVSQFEQHLRAILDLPLSKPELLCPAVMFNLLGPNSFEGTYAIQFLDEVLSIPGVRFHLYGKIRSKPGRKLGHVTVVAKSLREAMSRAKKAERSIDIIPVGERI